MVVVGQSSKSISNAPHPSVRPSARPSITTTTAPQQYDTPADSEGSGAGLKGLTALTQTFLRIFPRMCASRFFPSKQ